NVIEGRNFLFNLCDEHFLCPKCCGLQIVPNECFDTKIEKCKGVCCGKESVEEYNARVKQALEISLGKLETHIIIGKGRTDEEKSVVLIEQGEYKGFGYAAPETSMETPEEVSEIISPYHHNADVREILNWYLNSVNTEV
ncbi:MAG: DNA polymerase III subunit epsilon, partial [Bacteroidia bacterium]|nr:DNA polymerase III subunit epsilon [Bacteroidia bacterium]